MDTNQQKLQEAWRLKKEGKNDESLNCLLDIYHEHRVFPDLSTYSLTFSLMRTCKKTADAQKMYESMPEVFKKDKNAIKGFEWIVYDRIKSAAEHENWLIIADWLFQHATESDYSARNQLVWLACQRLWKSENKNWDQFAKWLKRVDQDNYLTTQTKTITLNGKNKEIASNYETWFYWRIKAAFKLGQYDEVIRLGKQIHSQKSLRLKYDHHIKSIIAQAFIQRGEPEQAIQQLKSIPREDWFTLRELAIAYRAAHQPEEALRHALNAVISKGIPESKVHLYRLLAELLVEQKPESKLIPDLLRAHIMCRNYYQSKKMDPELKTMIELNRIDHKEKFDRQHLSKIANKCKQMLEEKMDPAYAGKIERILDVQQIGFIRFEGFKFPVNDRLLDSAIFSLRDVSHELARQLAPGSNVKFDLRATFDKKKNLPSCSAYNIRLTIDSHADPKDGEAHDT